MVRTFKISKLTAMKKILVLLFAIIATAGYSQRWESVFTVRDDTTNFRFAVPKNAVVFDQKNVQFWKLTATASATDDLVTASKVAAGSPSDSTWVSAIVDTLTVNDSLIVSGGAYIVGGTRTDSLITDIIHPLDSNSVNICAHSTNSSLIFNNSVPKLGSMNVYYDAFKGFDMSAGNYYKSGKWYRSVASKNPLCFFEDLDNGKFGFWFAGSGSLNSEITWTTPVATIDSTGLMELDSISTTGGVNITGNLVVGNSQALADALEALVGGNLASLATPMDTVFTNIIFADTIISDSMITISSCRDVLDDGTINLPDATAGKVEIWISDGTTDEYIMARVYNDGTVTHITTNGSTANTDSDTNLCLYDGGTAAIIKNRLGSTLKVCYEYKYPQ